MDPYEPHEPNLAKEEKYGSGDPVLPYAIAAAVAVLGLLALHTVGGQPVAVSTTLAFFLLLAWLGMGLWLILIYPIVLWIPENRRHKWKLFFFSIILGILYFVVSGILMAHTSMPIQ